MEIEYAAIVAAAAVDAPNRKFRVKLEPRPPQREAVSDLPAVFFRELGARDGSRPILQKRLPLLNGENQIFVDVEKSVDIDRKLGEKILGVFMTPPNQMDPITASTPSMFAIFCR